MWWLLLGVRKMTGMQGREAEQTELGRSFFKDLKASMAKILAYICILNSSWWLQKFPAVFLCVLQFGCVCKCFENISLIRNGSLKDKIPSDTTYIQNLKYDSK